ncbi:MAG: hypothetical protein JXA14_22765 [Anaerolineae bacterium]|nr:hypothetical protein [Anaerolineae bacterium]
MHATSRRPIKLSYEPDYFVDRREALDTVLDKARRIATGEKEKRRVVVCRGQRGAGKTWLLRELEKQSGKIGVPAYYRLLSGDFDVREARRTMAAQPRPLLLLLDVDGARDELLDQLGDKVLSRLVNDTNVLIVLAERGSGHYWLIPEIREKSEDLDLGVFERSDVEAQIRKQVPDSNMPIEALMLESGGYPWANYILAGGPEDDRDRLEICVSAFLEGINGKLRDQFAALSVLRGFDEDCMPPLLCTYSDDFRARQWTYKECNALAVELIETSLTRYDDSLPAYVIDESLRRVIEAWLFARDCEKWGDLHQAAYEVYRRRNEQFPQNERWAAEKEYHAKRSAENRQ